MPKDLAHFGLIRAENIGKLLKCQTVFLPGMGKYLVVLMVYVVRLESINFYLRVFEYLWISFN